MRWNISAWSIRRPIPAIVLFMVLLAAGLFCFKTLGVDDDPNIDLPFVDVDVSMPGAAPAELESQITRQVEDAVISIGNIKHVNSTVSVGDSNTFIEFEFGSNIDRATNDVRDAIARIRSNLPADIPDPTIRRINNTDDPFVSYTVTSPHMDVAQLSWLVDNQISRAVLAVSGVADISRSGGVDREIRVELEPMALDSVGLTSDLVSSEVRALNINLPGGRGDVGDSEEAVRTLGSADTVAQLRNARLALPTGGWARLDSLGKVVDTSAEQRRAALLDGKPVVAFEVKRSMGANLVQVANAVDQALDNLQKTLPSDVVITKISTDATYVMESYRDSLMTLMIGAALAVLVIWIFLRDWRAAVISALAMPISVIPTFAAMKACNFTLNSMSLLGLSLVIGILVDDAIVEIENIVRHIHMGRNPYEAAIEAADEIGLAVVATTMTIIVVFVPVAFMGGIPGQYFKPFGITVAVAVFFSLVVARLLTPVMAAYWMQKPAEVETRSRLTAAYDYMLQWALRHRLATVLSAIGFFVCGLWLFSTIPTSLMTATDQGHTWVRVTLPPGSTLAQSTAVCQQMTAILHSHPEVETVYCNVGVDSASLRVKLVPKSERHISQMQFEDLVRPELKQVPGVRVSCGGGGMSNSLAVTLASDNGTDLTKAANDLMAQMRTVPLIAEVSSDAALQRPEIEVEPDLALAAEQGVTVASIANTAQIALLGDADMNLAKFNLPDRQINIRVELAPRYRADLQTIRNLRVLSVTNKLIPLDNVAKVELSIGENQIKRIDRDRQVTINANLTDGAALGTVLAQVHALPAYENLPKDVVDKPNGNVEIQGEVFSGFAAAMGAGILLIYAVLILLFADFLQPLTIMVSLPLSITGALVALVLARQPLGLYGLIGLLMLMGLATKNAILLVEYCIMEVHQGMDRAEAILKSGEARMRPILMTTVAMIAGMLPIAMGIGAGSEARAPMALTVIGGLITSTFLTLLVVPVVYTLVDDAKQWGLRVLRRGRPLVSWAVEVDLHGPVRLKGQPWHFDQWLSTVAEEQQSAIAWLADDGAAWDVPAGLRAKVDDQGRFRPLAGDTVVFPVPVQPLLPWQQALHDDVGSWLAQPLQPDHLTLHDLSLDPSAGPANEANCRRLFADLAAHLSLAPEDATIDMVSTRATPSVNVSVVLNLVPRTERDFRLLMNVYTMFDEVVWLSYWLRPHVTLAYFRPRPPQPHERQRLSGLLNSSRPPVTLALNLLDLAYQHFSDMQHYRTVCSAGRLPPVLGR